MKVGDLVYAPQYTFWGLGVIIETGKDGYLVHWFDEPVAQSWTDHETLEAL